MRRFSLLPLLVGVFATCGAGAATAQLRTPVPRPDGARQHYAPPSPAATTVVTGSMPAMPPCRGAMVSPTRSVAIFRIEYRRGYRSFPSLSLPYYPGISIVRPESGYTYAYPGYPSYLPAEELAGEPTPPMRPTPAPSSTESRAKGRELISAGDASFAEQKYSRALERYRSASRAAPDLAEPYFRQGFVLVAQGNDAAAVRAFGRALELRKETDPAMSLEKICGPAIVADTNERLAGALARAPLDRNLLTAYGMQLLYSGQPERARIYLSQAAELGALADDLVARLFPAPRPDAAAPAQPAGKLLTKVGL
jgi:tetratricopeptide (TPR) repeat protein